MFDASFKGFRVYFQTLELLRIFGDAIRETGQDLQTLDPAGFRARGTKLSDWDAMFRFLLPENPAEDEALRQKWEILLDFQQRAARHLLGQMNQKIEEIRSLRDGVSYDPTHSRACELD